MGNQIKRRELESVRKKFDAIYNSKTLPICKKCGVNDQVIPCVVGKPSADMLAYAQAGYAELQGCMVKPDRPYAKCKRCEVYIHEPIQPAKAIANKDI